jgi:spore maturation protein CgeB
VRIVFLGLSITSSWGNGHATNYRALVRELTRRGHDVLFCERDMPWYEAERDLPEPPWGTTALYGSVRELRDRFAADVREADLVVVGSYVPDGVEVGAWVQETARGVTAFYDIDTPVTLAKLAAGDHEYLAPELIPRYDLYLSFTGGPILLRLEHELGARRPRAFYCLVDPEGYERQPVKSRWDLGYLGTYSDDRQPAVDALLLEPARREPALRLVAGGPRYPRSIAWPANVERIEHVPPAAHASFYGAQRFTLNVTRAEMRRAGWSPSVRLFEAAACAVPVISDRWPGLDELFADGEEILVADGPDDVLRLLAEVDDAARRAIGERARRRVLAEHTAQRRVEQLEEEVAAVLRETRRAAA